MFNGHWDKHPCVPGLVDWSQQTHQRCPEALWSGADMLWMEACGRLALWVWVQQGEPSKSPKKLKKWTSLPVPENSDEERPERRAWPLRDDAARRALRPCLRRATRNRSTGPRPPPPLPVHAGRSSEECFCAVCTKFLCDCALLKSFFCCFFKHFYIISTTNGYALGSAG